MSVFSVPPSYWLASLSLLAVATLRGEEKQMLQPTRLPEGIQLSTPAGLLRLEVKADNIIRVAAAPSEALFARASLAVLPAKTTAKWDTGVEGGEAWLRTASLQVRVQLASGTVRFLTPDGTPILAERDGGREITPTEMQGEKTYTVHQRWTPIAGESLYGLGQRHTGLLDLKGYDLDLWQRNTHVVVPFLVSNRGYGIYWDNTSRTRFGDIRPYAELDTAKLYGTDGTLGGLTATYFSDPAFGKVVDQGRGSRIDIAVRGLPEDVCNARINPALPPGDVSIRWEGFIESPATGIHLLRSYSSGGLKLWVDGQLLIDHWRQEWLPDEENVKVPLTAGKRHAIRIDWVKDQKAAHLQLQWKTPSTDDSTALWSEVGDRLDYYFIYGPQLDTVVAGYRTLTGDAPMMPKWAFGLWQSRQRYTTQQESLDVVKGFRARGIPFDNIVQDWFYWKDDGWGSHLFDPERFPAPDAWIRDLHALHAKLMISVWGKFYKGTDTFNELQQRGFLYPGNIAAEQKDWRGYVFTFYDAFNPAARQLYWQRVNERIFSKGVDAWWMDASEPDLLPLTVLEVQRDRMNPTAAGTGARVLNAYPLVHAEAIYEGQRSAAPDQRVFNLTRSGFGGMQRYAAAVWSGDITSTWTALHKQIPAALGFSISGLPYWTMDCGGFSVPQRFQTPTPADAEEWKELNTRWFQFATFVPLTRVHGEAPFREMWEVAGADHPAYQTMLAFDRLRYRLLPYIYSVAGAVTREHATMMRPLVMDFPSDRTAAPIADEFLFGPALLVSPVYTYQARERQVYLPATPGGWFDFWTGTWTPGGASASEPAPYERIPLKVRAGSIIPFGPELQYVDEKPADPLTLVVYAGANGSFSLYEDDGVSYGYERGQSTTIPLTWDDATRTLTIGARRGTYPGLLAQRTFRVLVVSRAHPVGFSFDLPAAQEVRYTGSALSLHLP